MFFGKSWAEILPFLSPKIEKTHGWKMFLGKNWAAFRPFWAPKLKNRMSEKFLGKIGPHFALSEPHNWKVALLKNFLGKDWAAFRPLWAPKLKSRIAEKCFLEKIGQHFALSEPQNWKFAWQKIFSGKILPPPEKIFGKVPACPGTRLSTDHDQGLSPPPELLSLSHPWHRPFGRLASAKDGGGQGQGRAWHGARLPPPLYPPSAGTICSGSCQEEGDLPRLSPHLPTPVSKPAPVTAWTNWGEEVGEEAGTRYQHPPP